MNPQKELEPAEIIAIKVDPVEQPAVPSLPAIGLKVIRGSGIYALSNFGLKAINFLLLAIYSRFLAPADYGLVAISDLTAVIVMTIAGLGINNSIVRLYFQHAGDDGELGSFISSNLRFSLALYLGLGPLLLVTGWLAERWIGMQLGFAFFPFVALSLGAALFSQVIDFDLGIYQAQSRPKGYAMLSAALVGCSAVATVAWVVIMRWGARGLLWGKFMGAAAAAGYALFTLRQWRHAEWQWPKVRETLGLGLPLVPHQLIALGLVAADRFILSRYRGLEEIGLYSMAYTIGMMMYLITNAVALAWSPMFYSLAAQGNQGRETIARISRGLVGGLTLIACLGALVARPAVSLFLDAKYAAAGRLAPWIIGGYLMHSLFTVFQLSLFQAKKTSYIAMATVFALLLNVGLNFAWVPKYGMYGAAYATLAAYALEALLIYFLAQQFFRISFRAGEILSWCVLFVLALRFTQSGAAQSYWAFVFCAALLICLFVGVIRPLNLLRREPQ